MRSQLHLLVGIVILLPVACDSPQEVGLDGPALSIEVAPLTLAGVQNVCYSLAVLNEAGLPVWSKDHVCAGQYGNTTGGDITYVGTCDATDSVGNDGHAYNTVFLAIENLYTSAAPWTGDPTVAGDAAWRNPCADNALTTQLEGCELVVDCVENADAAVVFNLTVMREANQGFFDVAVNFEDIFCSAKLDTCYDETKRIELIHGADADRDWTAVFAFACTAGPTRPGQTNGPDTNLMLSKIEVVCPGSTFVIDPRLAQGNRSSTVGATTLNYAIYRGVEDLDCGTGAGSCNKKYWNVAFSLKDLDDAFSGACTLSLHATANDLDDTANTFTDGRPTGAGLSYPYVTVDVDLLNDNGAPSCQRHALNGPTQGVKTEYFGNTASATSPTTMCHQYSGGAASSTGGAGCGGHIYVPTGDFGQPGLGTNRIRVYNADATGFAQPIRTIESPALDFPAWCQVSGDDLFVSNWGSQILVLDKNAGGAVTPLRTISSNDLSGNHGIFIEGGEIFVASPWQNGVSVFPQNANGFVAATRTLTHSDLNGSTGVFVGGGELFTSRENTKGYAVHDRGASGNTAASRIVEDARPQARGIWATDTEVFLGATPDVHVYARNASGAATPLRTITVQDQVNQIVVKGDEVIVATSSGIMTYSKAGVLLRALYVPVTYAVCVD